MNLPPFPDPGTFEQVATDQPALLLLTPAEMNPETEMVNSQGTCPLEVGFS
jgi:hypothetical protein